MGTGASARGDVHTPLLTRRGLQICLGLLWLLDGALQLQPSMFTRSFATQVLAPSGQGQPAWVSDGVSWAVRLVEAHPFFWNSGFAVVQLLIGAGLVIPRRPRLTRLALAGSVAWALGVWYFGEGLGGLASGQADTLTGAPGAVLLYAVLALAAWPQRRQGVASGRLFSGGPPAAWVSWAWSSFWLGSVVLLALPGHMDMDMAMEIHDNSDGAPSWLAQLDTTIANGLGHTGMAVAQILVLLEITIGVLALVSGRVRVASAWTGMVLAVLFWVVGQGLGELYSGRATDPNSAPLIYLLGVAVLSVWGGTLRSPVAPAPAARESVGRPA